MKIYGYDRTSVAEVATGVKISNDAQWSKIKDVSVKYYNQEPAERFSDIGKSGNDSSRPGFDLLKDVVRSSDEKRVLLVWRYDRIARNAKVALEFLQLCDRHNVAVQSISEPLPFGSNSRGAAQQLFVQTLFVLAEAQSSSTIENINSGLAYKRSQGKYISSKVPFGYRFDKGNVLQEPTEATAIKRIFELYVTEKFGYKRLANQVNEEGFSFQGKSFQIHNIASILNNSLYCGIIKGGHFGNYKGNFKPIVDEKTFNSAQAIKKSREQIKVETRPYLLRKKIVCPFCKRKLTPESRRNDKGMQWFYYACLNQSCKGIRLPANKIEKEVIANIRDFLQNKKVFDQLLSDMNTALQELTDQAEAGQNKLQKTKIDVMTQFEHGEISAEQMRAELTKIEQANDHYKIKLHKKQYESKLKKIVELKNTEVQQIILREVDCILITEDKKISAIQLNGVGKNILKKVG